MTPHNPNPGKFSHGEEIRCVGGKLDGQTNPVSFVFHEIPGFNGGIPSSGFACGDEFYVLDHKRRAWVFAPKRRGGLSHLYRANRKRRGMRG